MPTLSEIRNLTSSEILEIVHSMKRVIESIEQNVESITNEYVRKHVYRMLVEAFEKVRGAEAIVRACIDAERRIKSLQEGIESMRKMLEELNAKERRLEEIVRKLEKLRDEISMVVQGES